MTTASLTIAVIAILIVGVLAWRAFGGADDVAPSRDWWRRRRGSPPRED